MKIIISIIFSALLGAVMLAGPVEDKATELEFTNRFEKAEPCTLRIKLCYLISGFPSFKKDPCRGLGFKCLEWDNCEKKERFDPNSAEEGKTQILFENLSLNELKITFYSSERNERNFIIDQFTSLPKQIASGFGLNSITVTPGTYPVIYNSDKSLSTVLKVKTE